jgi:hypothetical protein
VSRFRGMSQKALADIWLAACRITKPVRPATRPTPFTTGSIEPTTLGREPSKRMLDRDPGYIGPIDFAEANAVFASAMIGTLARLDLPAPRGVQDASPREPSNGSRVEVFGFGVLER